MDIDIKYQPTLQVYRLLSRPNCFGALGYCFYNGLIVPDMGHRSH
jgi:hypothetical protein